MSTIENEKSVLIRVDDGYDYKQSVLKSTQRNNSKVEDQPGRYGQRAESGDDGIPNA